MLNLYAKSGLSVLAVVISVVALLTKLIIIKTIENGIDILTNNSKYSNTLFVKRLVLE